ncbi:MAG: hypothetical protein ACOYL8_02860 [Patescibacteria group bacterium]
MGKGKGKGSTEKNVVPDIMPKGAVMKEVEDEIAILTQKENSRREKRINISKNLFIAAIVTASSLTIVWLSGGLIFSPAKAGEPRLWISLIGLASSFVLYKLFKLYAERGSWKNRRKRGILSWLIVIFAALAMISCIL